MSTTAATFRSNPTPPIVALKARPAPKPQPCLESDCVACRCAVCLRPLEGRVHIAIDDLKLTCAKCCAACNTSGRAR